MAGTFEDSVTGVRRRVAVTPGVSSSARGVCPPPRPLRVGHEQQKSGTHRPGHSAERTDESEGSTLVRSSSAGDHPRKRSMSSGADRVELPNPARTAQRRPAALEVTGRAAFERPATSRACGREHPRVPRSGKARTLDSRWACERPSSHRVLVSSMAMVHPRSDPSLIMEPSPDRSEPVVPAREEAEHPGHLG